MKPRKSFLLRMDPALYQALEAWAAQELRSLNGQIEYVLKEAVAKHRRPLPPEPTQPEKADDVSDLGGPGESSEKPRLPR